MNYRTISRIAMCVSGIIRVSATPVNELYDIKIEIPFAKGVDAEKLNKLLPDSSRKELTHWITEKGGKDNKGFVVESDGIAFTTKYGEADNLISVIKKLAESDKNINKSLNLKGIQKHYVEVGKPNKEVPEDEVKALIEERKLEGKELIDDSGNNDSDIKKQENGKSSFKDGFTVEIPLNIENIVDKLNKNSRLKGFVEEFEGKQKTKGKGMIFDFPNKKQRKEILNELSDVIESSKFLKSVLDMDDL